MRTRRLARLAPMTLLGLAAVLAQPAAASAAADPVQVIRDSPPYAFTLTPAECPQLAVALSGSGNYDNVTTTNTDPSGATHQVIRSIANGPAIDALGNTYRLSYYNLTTADAPAGGYPRTELVIDHFRLQGAGPDNGLQVEFITRLTFAGPGQPPTRQPVYRNGSPACDPI